MPEDAEAPAYDLAAARAEVEQSQYTGSGPIPLTHVDVANTAFEEEISLLFKATLDQIGFDVTNRPEPWNRIAELASSIETTPHTTQVFYGPTYPPPGSACSTRREPPAPGPSMDWVQDPEVDDLIRASRTETDPDARDRQGHLRQAGRGSALRLAADAGALARGERVSRGLPVGADAEPGLRLLGLLVDLRLSDGGSPRMW